MRETEKNRDSSRLYPMARDFMIMIIEHAGLNKVCVGLSMVGPIYIRGKDLINATKPPVQAGPYRIGGLDRRRRRQS
jgi:hypothetical protein